MALAIVGLVACSDSETSPRDASAGDKTNKELAVLALN